SVSASNAGDAVCVGGCGTAVTATPVDATTPTGSAGTTGGAARMSGTSPSASAELAFTGLSSIVPIVAVLLVAAGLAGLSFRRRRATL
ncbi:MAG TPA: hypothetical protein VIJ71_03775, partial [Mycobacteriales bacterium]